MRALALAALLAGCGRIAFDRAPDATDASACGVPATAPDRVTIAGTTFEYTSFDNESAPLRDVIVRARDAAGTIVAQTLSGDVGVYSLVIATGGAPTQVVIDYALGTHYTTKVVPDLPLASDITAPAGEAVWQLGAAPLWTAATMDAIYEAAGVTLDPTKATLNIAARDCDGASVEGVTFEVSPPPEQITYQNPDGTPSPDRTATVAPFTHAIVLNAVPGLTRITAQAAEGRFLEQEIVVGAGAHNTLVIARRVE